MGESHFLAVRFVCSMGGRFGFGAAWAVLVLTHNQYSVFFLLGSGELAVAVNPWPGSSVDLCCWISY
jgi:hypothetical protein